MAIRLIRTTVALSIGNRVRKSQINCREVKAEENFKKCCDLGGDEEEQNVKKAEGKEEVQEGGQRGGRGEGGGGKRIRGEGGEKGKIRRGV